MVEHMVGFEAVDVDSICLSRPGRERCLAVTLCVHPLLHLPGDSPKHAIIITVFGIN